MAALRNQHMQGTPQQGRSPHRKQTVVPLDDPEAPVEIEMASGDAQTNGGTPSMPAVDPQPPLRKEAFPA